MKNSAILTDRSLLSLSGSDAESFLQNLITCDVEKLGSNQASFGALLTPQGKILFEFLLLKRDDGFLLDIHAELCAEFEKRLMFYRLRADVQIERISTPICVQWGDIGDFDNNWFVDPRSPSLGIRSYSSQISGATEPGEWHKHRIGVGVPELVHDFDGSSVYPHDVHYHRYQEAGVDFSKGCYVGQEVVSRMHHRGTGKNTIVHCHTFDNGPMPPKGTEIQAGSKKVGTTGSSIGSVGLAMVRRDRVEQARTDNLALLADGQELQVNAVDISNFGQSN